MEGGGENKQPGKDGGRHREMQRVRKKSGKRGGRLIHGQRGWEAEGGGGAIDGKDERDGGKEQHHFSSPPTGPHP